MKRLPLYLTWFVFVVAGSAWYFFGYRPLLQAHTQLKLDYVSLQDDNESLQGANEVLAAERDQALRSKHNIDKMALELGDALESCNDQLSLAPWAQTAVQLGEALAPDQLDINGLNLGLPNTPRSRR